MQPPQETINLRQTYSEKYAAPCSYCGNTTQKEYRFTAHRLTPATSERLSNQGWARYQEDYFKPFMEQTCCKQWTRRMDVTQFQIKKEQKSTMRKTIRFFMGKEKKEAGLEQAKLNSMQQQKKKEAKAIAEEDYEILKTIIAKIDCEVRERLPDLIKQLQKKQILQIEPETLDLVGLVQKTQYFVSRTPQKAEYFSNYVMLLYGMFKKHFPKNYQIPQFVEDFQQIMGKKEVDGFVLNMEKSGYLLFKRLKLDEEKKVPSKKTSVMKEEKPSKKCYKKQQPVNKDELQFIISDDRIICGKLEIRIEKASYTEQKFQLWDIYRGKVHGKPNNHRESFRSFICWQGLQCEEIKLQNPCNKVYQPVFDETLSQKIDSVVTKRMGCYHMNYYFEGKLIGVNAMNFLPSSMESIYFFYAPEFKFDLKMRMGVFSALVDIEYMRWMNLSFPEFKYYNMCYYIQNCRKMSYKAEYEPFQLLCPVTGKWVTFSPEVREKIDKIDKRETLSLKIGEGEVDENSQLPEDMQMYIIENLKLQLQNQQDYLMYHQGIINIMELMLRSMGRQLCQHFVWTLK